MRARESTHRLFLRMWTCWKPIFSFQSVIIDFYHENDYRWYCRNQVCDYKRPVVDHESLDNEKYTTESKQKERRHRYAVGVACAYGIDGLWKITAHHADGGGVAYDVDD